MNIDTAVNKIRSSFASLPLSLQSEVKKKAPVDKYTLLETKVSQPMSQLGAANVARFVGDSMRACGACLTGISRMKRQGVPHKLRRSKRIGGVLFPRGTTIFYMYAPPGEKRRLWGARLIRNQSINGIKCGRGYIKMFLSVPGNKLRLRYVQRLSRSQYVKSQFGLIKVAKNDALLFLGNKVSAKIAAPKTMGSGLVLPVGTHIVAQGGGLYPSVLLGRDITHKGILFKKGTELRFYKSGQISVATLRTPHVIKGVQCSRGQIWYKPDGSVKSVDCITR